MSSKTRKQSKSSTPAPAPVAPVVAPAAPGHALGASSDALKGRIGCRTHAIHAVLMAHYPRPIPRGVIVTESVALLGADHPSAPKFGATLGSHLNTMRLRGFIAKGDGGWVLTPVGAELAGVSEPAPAPAPAPKKRRGKK